MGITATEDLLSVPEVGDRLGVSIYTVRRWIKSGDLPAYRPGKEYRIKSSDLEEFLQTREVSPKVQRPPESDYAARLEELDFPSEQIAAYLAENEREEEFIRRELEKMSAKDFKEALMESRGLRRIRKHYHESGASEPSDEARGESA